MELAPFSQDFLDSSDDFDDYDADVIDALLASDVVQDYLEAEDEERLTQLQEIEDMAKLKREITDFLQDSYTAFLKDNLQRCARHATSH